jgi:SAM-dependent methyltransferase
MDPAVGAEVERAKLAHAAKQALAIYAEEHIQRGVIAVLGDASAGIGELALRLGARAVHVWDPDVDRALAAAGSAVLGLSVWPLVRPREDLTRRDFDVVIVSELGLFRDPAAVLSEVRRMVGQDGVAIVMARNPEAEGGPDADPDVDAERAAAHGRGAGHAKSFDYYELFDAVAAEFDFVRMVAQLPFRGVALVELGDGDAEGESEGRDPGAGVSVDTQLVDEGGPPDAFVAVASQRDTKMAPYAIVQLPADAGVGVGVGVGVGAAADAAEATAALAAAVAAAREDAAAAITAAESAAARAAAAAESAITRLESTLAERTSQLAAFARELDETRAAAESARLTAAEELDELIARVDRAERKSVELAAALAASQASQANTTHADSSAAEHEVLERTLRERAQVIRELEAEVLRRERLVRDLAGALEEASLASLPSLASFEAPPPALAARLDAMALELARRESEAQAAAWENEELKRRLAIAERGAPGPAPDAGHAPAPSAAALDELDALRRALVQEHDARVRAESGEAGRGRDGPASAAPAERSPAPTEQR